MGELDSDESEYALWSSLSLEFLARAALANITPALLADTKEGGWSSLYSALGFTPTEERFAPRSIAISEVFKRLSAISPSFAKENASFGIQHTGQRNAELHSGESAFEGVKASSWQPRFYQTCQVLLGSMGLTLQDFLGREESEVAERLITAAADESAKVVMGDIEAHKADWGGKPQSERDTLTAQAALWASRQAGHGVKCPSCASHALVDGEPVSAPSRKLDGDFIVETHEHLPSRFECIACGLKIAGLSRLAVAGLADRFKKTSTYDPVEIYAPGDDYSGYEEDNNEY
ncbi:MAG: hypothetical protein ACRD25_07015 [Terracidiphilus sp.]